MDNKFDTSSFIEEKKQVDNVFQELKELEKNTEKESIISKVRDDLKDLNNSIDAFNSFFKSEIKVLNDIYKDYLGIYKTTWDKKYILDFKHNYLSLSEAKNRLFERIWKDDIVILSNDYYSELNPKMKWKTLFEINELWLNTMLKRIETILRNNSNTQVIYIDLDLSIEETQKIMNLYNEINNKSIKIVFTDEEQKESEIIVNNWGVISNPLLKVESSFSDIIYEIYSYYFYDEVLTKWTVIWYWTDNKKILSTSDTINLIINPSKISDINLDNKKTDDSFKMSHISTIDINKTNNSDIDKKIIIIWWEKPSYEDWDYDTFLYNWERYSWSEVIANTIINNPINKKVEY